MTGVTQAVQCARRIYCHGRWALLSRLPAGLRSALISSAESAAFANPLGDMPMPKLEFFQVLINQQA